jgi:hypothetical protein
MLDDQRMDEQPRRHHVVPKVHLQHFANSQGQVRVVRRDGRSWLTGINNVAVCRDHYRVPDGVLVNPFGPEKDLAIFEGTAAPVLERIINRAEHIAQLYRVGGKRAVVGADPEDETLARGKERYDLALFLWLLATRSNRARERFIEMVRSGVRPPYPPRDNSPEALSGAHTMSLFAFQSLDTWARILSEIPWNIIVVPHGAVISGDEAFTLEVDFDAVESNTVTRVVGVVPLSRFAYLSIDSTETSGGCHVTESDIGHRPVLHDVASESSELYFHPDDWDRVESALLDLDWFTLETAR